MDAVSDVLRVVRLGGAVFLNGEFTAPWSLVSQADAALCVNYLPPSERVVSYHLITEGSCWAHLAGSDADTAVCVSAGELLVVPHGEAHVMGSAPGLPSVPAGPLLASQMKETPGEVIRVRHGGGGAATRIVCGFLACNETLSNPLLASLPRLFKIDMRNDPRSSWLQSSLEIAANEAAEWRAGSAIVLARLSELLFVEALRRCIEQLPPERKGWLAAARDRYVSRTLALLHAQPTRAWTVEELARLTGLSRSALAQRFTELLGQPPMQYLARWRLQIAGQELLASGSSVATVAARVGYDSEAAFSRAFKREFGMPPAAWRKARARHVQPPVAGSAAA